VTRGPARTAPRLVAGLLVILIAATAASPTAADPGASEATVSALVRVSPLQAELSLSPAQAGPRLQFEIDVRVRNLGATRLRDLNVVLHVVEQPCLRLMGPNQHHRGLLPPGDHVDVRWRAEVTRAGPACGSIVVAASASAFDPEAHETVYADSPARVLGLP
jgi:hypothetical protein